MALDQWIAALFPPLLWWIAINGIDDMVIGIAWLFLTRDEAPREEPSRECRMAILAPLWKEHRVIESMVAQNAGALRYRNYDIFIGVYPNDEPTVEAVERLEKRFANVHAARVPHDGPTSKADCLNWIYQRMLQFEEQKGVCFEMILTHDAEDVIHPDSLTEINRHAGEFDMVQIPVLALPTPVSELTHGFYCDDFAQFELMDMPVREMLGGFIPSSGVGTAYSRRILQRLAVAYGNRIFEPACLTEDYENGYRVHWMGGRQKFVRVRHSGAGLLATREYFPRSFRAAVRQRTRWATGITFQSWELHGFWETVGQLYWFWRDRKGMIGNIAAPLANLLTAYGLIRGCLPAAPLVLAFAPQLFHVAVRMSCSAMIYGWGFAAMSPVRSLWGNWINGFSAAMAAWNYVRAKMSGRPLRWAKSEHIYPNLASLEEHRRTLEEVLTGSAYITEEALAAARASQPPHRGLAAHLLQTGAISEESLYEAISLQQALPLGKPDEITGPVTRSFPAAVARKWKVLPFKLKAGHLHVAGSEPPTEEMHRELRTFSSMEIRFQLITPSEFEQLAREYLPGVSTAPGDPVSNPD